MKNLIGNFKIDARGLTGPVMVTGAGGCIGSWIVAMLHSEGIPTIAMDLEENDNRLKLLMDKDDLSSVNWATGDITDSEYIFKSVEKHQPQAMIHLAALQIPFCAEDPILGAKVNVVGLVNIMEAARKYGVKRVAYASSLAVHGAINPTKFQPTLYGVYKKCNEDFCHAYFKNTGVSSIGLRPGNVYGVARDQGLTAKITQAILAAAAGKPFTIPFSGPTSALYAGEVAAAFIQAVSNPVSGALVFDINGSWTSVEEWVQLIKTLNPNADITIDGPTFPLPTELNDEPLRTSIGNYAAIDLAEGTKITYEAFSQLLADKLIDA